MYFKKEPEEKLPVFSFEIQVVFIHMLGVGRNAMQHLYAAF